MKSAPLSTVGILVLCWKSAGGWKGTLRSFDFWCAIGVWTFCMPFWLKPEWPSQVIGVLPNLLGFTLGGFAVFLGFGSDDFKSILAEPRPGTDQDLTPYASTSSAFMYFVTAQLAALLYALAANGLFAWPLPRSLAPFEPYMGYLTHVGSGLGYFLFVYSLTLALRAAFRIFRLSRWYNAYLGQPDDH